MNYRITKVEEGRDGKEIEKTVSGSKDRLLLILGKTVLNSPRTVFTASDCSLEWYEPVFTADGYKLDLKRILRWSHLEH